ncbi:NRG-like protein [Mya arenaria]|uniref:NRG-like protein n=1 Tax=Mya arenaria TaxID=6604 RepID=A0ABY7FS46_MYAAR|nr:NRG-like protein [Mya arenaria]
MYVSRRRVTMAVYETLVTLGAFVLHCCLAIDLPPRITQPPTIMPEPRLRDVIYFDPEGTAVKEFPCRALGSNPKEFTWTKNGRPFNINDPKYIANDTSSRIVRIDSNTGTLKFLQFHEMDEGQYQCIAKNNHGTSLSKKFRLVKATKKTFENPLEEPTRHSVKPADPLKLTCNPPKNDPPGIARWVRFKDEGTGKGTLYFANIVQEDDNDNEKYACEVQLKSFGMYIEGDYSYIEILKGIPQAQYPPELSYQSDQFVVGLKGDKVSFICIFSGHPTPTVTWWKGSERIQADSRHRLPYPWKLTLQDLEYADAGDYKCKGSNSVLSGSIDRSFKVEVEAKPEWAPEPMKVDAGVDESAAFECGAEGKPTPSIRWFIDGIPVEYVKDDKMVVSPGQLQFNDLTPLDAKVVQCNASNQHGYLWADVPLSVLAYKPESRAGFDRIKISEGQDVILPCEIDGKPTPTIYWKRGGLKMEGVRYIMNPTGNLTIKSARSDDAGTWTCFAENKYGKFNASGELLVRAKTVIGKPPVPVEQQMMYNKVLQFTCGATTDPAENSNLKYTWYKDGEPIKFDSRVRRLPDVNGIKIENTIASDTGTYTCEASNGLDSDKRSADVGIVAPPDPPTNINVGTCIERRARISWTPGKANLRRIDTYYVEYNHSYAPHIWTRAATVSGDKTEAEVRLSPHANYTFRVIAENQIGKSAPSERGLTGCDTPPSSPEKHPQNVEIDRSLPGWLIINWDRMPEIEHNGDNFHYKVTYTLVGQKNSSAIFDWRENEKRVNTGLFYEPVQVYVEAVNDEGSYSKPASVTFGYTGEAEPLTAPSNFELVKGVNVTAKTATFQWDPVDLSPQMMRGEFKGYTIRYWKAGEKDTTLKEVDIARNAPPDPRVRRAVPEKKEQEQVNDLPPYSDLEAEVVARNTYFRSNASNLVNFTTPEGVPSKPRSARVLLRGARHFLIEWEKPTQPNGIITGFKIGYKKVNGFNVGELVVTNEYPDPDEDRGVMDKLDANTEYIIYVMASTSKGYGDAIYFDAKTANDGPLIIPKIRLELVGEDFVNVTWDIGANTDSPAGSFHFVQYREVGSKEWVHTDEERINTWMNVSGLQPNTRYEMIVFASNGKFEQPSDMESFTTMGGLQEREKLRGADLENGDKDLFNEYPKSGETDPLAAGSPDSFDNEVDRLPGGSETDSMADYGDVDPSKFNEDGSFIGQYGPAKTDEKGNPASAMSTFV